MNLWTSWFWHGNTDFRLLASRPVRESYSLFGSVLQQPEETNTSLTLTFTLRPPQGSDHTLSGPQHLVLPTPQLLPHIVTPEGLLILLLTPKSKGQDSPC